MPVVTPIVLIIGATTGVVGGVDSARNRKLRRQYEQNLAALDLEEKKRLEKELVEAKNLEERKQILAETLGKATQTRIEAIEKKKAESQKALNKLLLIGGIGAVILIVGLIIVANKRKS